jgi:hypothetical protein
VSLALASVFDAAAFDEAAIRAHVTLVHERAAGVHGVLVVSVFHVDPDCPAKADRPGVVTRHKVGDVDSTVHSIMAHATTPNANVYLGLQVMRHGLRAKQRGGTADIVASLVLVADMDADTGKAGTLPCKPSLVIETSPGNRQALFVFAHPVTQCAAKPLAVALRSATDSDSGTADPAHVWRVPGTRNWPNHAKILRGRSREPATVTVTEPFAGVVYTADALAAHLAPWMRTTAAPGEATKATGANRDAEALFAELSTAAREKLTADVDEGERSEHAARVYEQLSHDGFDLDGAIALVRAHGGTWRDRYAGEDKLVADAERLWTKFAHHAADRAEAEAGAAPFIVQGDAAAQCVGAPANDDADPWFPVTADVDPFDFAAGKGLLAAVAQCVHDRSYLPVTELSMLASIATLCGVYGRRFASPTGLGLNLYLIGLAQSSGGKDDPLTAPQEIFAACGLMHLVGPGDVTSDGAIETVLRHNACLVMAMDEVGIFFQGVKSKAASGPESKIRKSLLDLYTKSKVSKFWTGKGYSDPAGKERPKLPIQCPTLSVLGVSVEEEFYDGMCAKNIKDGVFGRFTVIKVSQPGDRNRNLNRDIPDELRDALKAAAGNALGSRLGDLTIVQPTDVPKLIRVPWSKAAETRWNDIDDHVRALGHSKPGTSDIIGRGPAQAQVLATIRALGVASDPRDARVTRADIEWGWVIIRRSLNTIQSGIDEHLSDSDFEQLCKVIRRFVIAAGAEGIAESVLLRRKGVSKAEPRMFDSATKWLEAADRITIRKNDGPGVKGKRYYAKP